MAKMLGPIRTEGNLVLRILSKIKEQQEESKMDLWGKRKQIMKIV